VPFSFLPYRVAETLFLFLVSSCLIAAGYLLHDSSPGLSRWTTIMIVVGFLPSLFAAQTSQTAPLILLLAATAWRSLEQGRDRLAGIALASLTIKPQLSVAIVLGGLVWSARRRRWAVLASFATVVGLACLGSTLLRPDWPRQMLRALSTIPLPTESHPEIGVT